MPRLLFLLLLLLAAAPGCLLRGGGGVPEWIDNPPADRDHLYAIGSYVGSLYPEDNRRNATKEAIRNLSAQIRTRVKDRRTMTGAGNATMVRRRAEMVAENAVRNAQPVAFWVDREGRVEGGREGTVYVLVRAPIAP